MRLLPEEPSDELRAQTGFVAAVCRNRRLLAFCAILLVAAPLAGVISVPIVWLFPEWLAVPVAGLLLVTGVAAFMLGSLFLLVGLGLVAVETVWGPTDFPAGRCQKCGYDLTGNESGVCPECGTGVAGRPTNVQGAVPAKNAKD